MDLSEGSQRKHTRLPDVSDDDGVHYTRYHQSSIANFRVQFSTNLHQADDLRDRHIDIFHRCSRVFDTFLLISITAPTGISMGFEEVERSWF